MPTKALGAEQARGQTLVFLDGHTNPEPGALERLIEDVEQLNGQAIVTPEVPALDERSWTNARSQRGNGYYLELEKLNCGWLPLKKLRPMRHGRKLFYESPALIGCVLAIARPLYDQLQGFDPHMRFWGVEDLDFGLKCWLLGHRIVHDPAAVVGHRFRESFDNYEVPVEHVVANQLRMARKHLGHTAWSEWLDRCRQRHTGRLADHPEGLWARAWQVFEADRASVEQERSVLHARRVRDEFWFAERFGLDWPKLASPLHRGGRTSPGSRDVVPNAPEFSVLDPSPSPSPSLGPLPSPEPEPLSPSPSPAPL